MLAYAFLADLLHCISAADKISAQSLVLHFETDVRLHSLLLVVLAFSGQVVSADLITAFAVLRPSCSRSVTTHSLFGLRSALFR